MPQAPGAGVQHPAQAQVAPAAALPVRFLRVEVGRVAQTRRRNAAVPIDRVHIGAGIARVEVIRRHGQGQGLLGHVELHLRAGHVAGEAVAGRHVAQFPLAAPRGIAADLAHVDPEAAQQFGRIARLRPFRPGTAEIHGQRAAPSSVHMHVDAVLAGRHDVGAFETGQVYLFVADSANQHLHVKTHGVLLFAASPGRRHQHQQEDARRPGAPPPPLRARVPRTRACPRR
ncbi:hypothetical protein D9M72_308160 [compost metagenome]